MEKYQSCFDEEEIDLPIFLTMSEADLEGIGIKTLGARRKLMLAISGMSVQITCMQASLHRGQKLKIRDFGGAT